MAAGVGVFRTECRAEGVDFAQRRGISFTVQLTGYSQEGFPAEKVFAEIHFAFVVTRQVVEIQSGDAEHFTGTFGIGGGDQRGGYPEETLLVKETV